MKKLAVATGFALALTAGSAIAADLPSRKSPPVYVPPAPVLSWTGFYAGVNIGYGFNASGSNVTGADTAAGTVWSYGTPGVSGVLGGGQLGYNWQFPNNFLVGVEADWQGADLSGGRYGFGVGPGTVSSLYSRERIEWFGTLRGRAGYLFTPALLLYVTGGFAYGDGSTRTTIATSNAFTGQGAESSGRYGFSAGGGLEWMFLPNWSAKVEYLYTDMSGDRRLVGPQFGGGGAPAFGNGFTQTASNPAFHTVRAGLNWHFNPFAPAPIVAKY
jgi:outer membrane immunogenic protein